MSSTSEQNDVLFEKLRRLRSRLAEREGLPPYFVFHDRNLHEMAKSAPMTLDAFQRIRGVGPKKLERYGEEFLREIRAHVSSTPNQPVDSESEVSSASRATTETPSVPQLESATNEGRTVSEAGMENARQSMANMPRPPMPWVVLAVLWAADWLIWLMLRPRSDERLVRPTKRVYWHYGLKRELMQRQNNTCAYCGRKVPARAFEIDHMMPAYRGGSNDKENLQVLCRPCNTLKGIHTDAEFRTRYSKLVPPEPLTPPRRRISHSEFRAEAERTGEPNTLRKFNKSRFYPKSMKIGTGCITVFGATAFAIVVPLHFGGSTGFQLALPPVIFGGIVAFGIWLRAYVTGAMLEDDS